MYVSLQAQQGEYSVLPQAAKLHTALALFALDYLTLSLHSPRKVHVYIHLVTCCDVNNDR